MLYVYLPLLPQLLITHLGLALLYLGITFVGWAASGCESCHEIAADKLR
jgi:hypothetical protein